MISREDLVMVNGAVVNYNGEVNSLAWSARNGLAVRGTQNFTGIPSVGKTHADLWGLKSGSADQASSFETPGVAGYAASLISVAASKGWSNGTNGLRHEVVKSVLMTGADTAGTTTTSGGFNSWKIDTVNNLDAYDGAGRADYSKSLSILTAGTHSMAKASGTVSGSTITSPIVTTATDGWCYTTINKSSTQALVIHVTDATLTDLTATLAWDVTQSSTDYTIDTTDSGVQFPNLNLELRPVTYSNSKYTLGSSLGYSGLLSNSTDDNVEHLYFTNTLAAGYYAFLINNCGTVSTSYGFSYSFDTIAQAVPEPAAISLLLVLALCLGIHRARTKMR